MSAQGSGETRLSDQIAYHRSLCDAAKLPPTWYHAEDLPPADVDRTDAAFIAAHSPDVVSALLDVAEAAQKVAEDDDIGLVSDLNSALAALSQRMEERA